MNMKKTSNYPAKMDACIAATKHEGSGTIPRLLLHSCCAPCSTSVITSLSPHFDITVFYYNPNIDAPQEYKKRAEEQRILLTKMTTPNPVTFLEGEYNPDDFLKFAAPYASEPEGGIRCTHCYSLRLEKTAQIASQLGFTWFTTTLSVSPLKDEKRINAIGNAMGEKYGVFWLWSNFKKRNGYLRSVQMGKELGLYRQNYCGCSFSQQD